MRLIFAKVAYICTYDVTVTQATHIAEILGNSIIYVYYAILDVINFVFVPDILFKH